MTDPLATSLADPARSLVERVRASPEWQRAAVWGVPRPGHPEGTIGRHVEAQVLPFIDLHYRELADYWSLVALAYLHDIGKPDVEFREGQIRGATHGTLSAQIAASLGAPDRLLQVILRNDRAYSFWRRLHDSQRHWTPARWTATRRANFVRAFDPTAVDLELLVRFHRADNAYRRTNPFDESVDSVRWFENRLLEEQLLAALPLEGKDQIYDWTESG